MYADITYQLPSQYIYVFEKVSQRISSERVSAKTYLDFYDILFPTSDEAQDSQISLIVSAEIGIKYPKGGLFQRMCLVPWVLQGQLVSGNRDWDGENIINATVCKSAYRIEPALHSFYTIAIISVLVLVWCLIRSIQSVLHAKPSLSPFSEINVVEMILGGSQDGNLNESVKLFARSSTIETSKIVQLWRTTRVYVRGLFENEINDHEMNTLG